MASLGLTTINEIEVHEVDVDPSVSGVDAPVGSLAIITDGTKIYLKTNTLATDWKPVNSLERTEYSYKMTANQTSTSTTYANATELVTTSLPVGIYLINFYGIAQSTATTTGIGVRLGVGTATLSTNMSIKWELGQAADGTAKNFQYDQLAATTNVTSTSAITANTNFLVNGTGMFEVTVAGTVAIQLRTEVSASGVSLRTGSSLFIKKLEP